MLQAQGCCSSLAVDEQKSGNTIISSLQRPSLLSGLALLFAGTGALLLLQNYFSANDAEKIITDTGGEINVAVVSVNSARKSALRNAELTSDIINKLPARIKIFILAPDRDAFTVVSNPWKDRIQFIDMPEEYELTIWPQDPFIVLHGPTGTRLLASRDFERAEDYEMAQVLSRHLKWPMEYSSLSFEGGNIVSDEHYVYVGANTIRFNAIRENRSEAEIADILKEELGKPVIVIGPLPQPVGHIDMMLTPLGNKHLLLADPAWGARLAEQNLINLPEQVEAFEKQCEQNFFGHSDIKQVTNHDGEIIRPPKIVGATQHAIKDSKSIAEDLDRVSEELTKLGFKVSRVPFLYRKPEISYSVTEGETIPSKPDYPYITYNNVLTEITSDKKIVYLPAYGWASLDAAGYSAWKELGYDIHTIPGFSVTAMYGGALRCSVKVLSRN